jgi:hypothetical protein
MGKLDRKVLRQLVRARGKASTEALEKSTP